MADPTEPTDQPAPTARPARKRRTAGFGVVLAVGAAAAALGRLRRRPDLGHRRHHQPGQARGRGRRLRRGAGDVPARAGRAGLLGRLPRAAHARAPRRRGAGRAGSRGRSGRRDPLRTRRHRCCRPTCSAPLPTAGRRPRPGPGSEPSRWRSAWLPSRIAFVKCAGWAQMSRRYDRDGATSTPGSAAAAEATPADQWRAMDDGRDPTV